MIHEKRLCIELLKPKCIQLKTYLYQQLLTIYYLNLIYIVIHIIYYINVLILLN